MFNFNYWKYIIFIFPLLILVGCTTTKPRYYTAYVERVEIAGNAVMLQAGHTFYLKYSDPEKLNQLRQFKTDYAPYIERESWTIYDNGNHDEQLQYRADIETQNLNVEQERILQDKYAAKMENQMWTVNFIWDGAIIASSIRANKVDEKYTLKIPQKLTIVETHKAFTPLGELLFIPFMPIYMMVGCAFAEASCI